MTADAARTTATPVDGQLAPADPADLADAADAAAADPQVDPEVGEVRFTVISVDDHVVEPPHLFEGRMPAALADRAPYVRTTSKGHEIWVFDGQAYPQVGLNAVVG